MPRIADYSTTVIYKITCKDSNITDKYVGHTTDLVRRRQEHKNNTCSENSPQYNIKLYKFIRDNGGWDNWKMEVVNFYNCINLSEARQKEHDHYVELNASLNSMEPLNTKETKIDEVPRFDVRINHKYLCEKCNYRCRDTTDLEKHKKSKKHTSDGVKRKFECILCDYTCNISSLLNKHKLTNKHKTRQTETGKYINCGTTTNKINSPIDSDVMAAVKQLIVQNNEFKDFIVKQADDNKNEILNIIERQQIERSNNNLSRCH